MSREIKFRAWIKTGVVTYDYVKPMTIQQMIHSKKSTFSLKQLNDLVDFEQYTGLKDQNGKDIYEGDIIKYFGANKRVKIKTTYGIVFYDSEHGCFNSRIQNEEHNKGGISPLDDLIVGNVHTNPELLEAKQ